MNIRFPGDVSKPLIEKVYPEVKSYLKDVLPIEKHRDYER